MNEHDHHLVKAIDATAREDADNEQKTINHVLRFLTKTGAIPDRVPGKPWYAVSIDPSRHWDTAKGEMPVAIRAETGADEVDASVNREVVLCGDQIGYWRVPLVAGKADVTVLLTQFEKTGEGQLFVLDAAETERQGSTPSFTWG